jgi:hypothetical protein
MKITCKRCWSAAALLTLPYLVLPLAAQQSISLIIAGRPGSAKVTQVDGHNYVEVEGFARLTNASVNFNGSQFQRESNSTGVKLYYRCLGTTPIPPQGPRTPR